MKKIFTSVILILIFCSTAVFGQSGEKDWLFNLSGVRWYYMWGLDLLPTGADLRVGYKGLSLFPGKDTIFQITAGAGYESFNLYRETDGAPALPLSNFEKKEFDSWIIKWEPGIRQGLLWNERLDKNLLEAFLFYRGRFDLYQDGRVIWGTSEADAENILSDLAAYKEALIFDDRNGILSNSLFTGIAVDNLTGNKLHRTREGVYAEASLEWNPKTGSASPWTNFDFLRLNASVKGFHTLYDAAEADEKNRFSVYLCDYFQTDYAFGDNVPMFVMQSIGGTVPRDGLGDKAIRGFERYTYDTAFKIVNNLEIRANLPALYYQNLVPGVLAYVDAGYYNGFEKDPGENKQGFLCSTGLGVYLDGFGIEYVRMYINFPLIGDRVDGKNYALDVNFSLHF